jgi:hypothetical protein
MALLATILAQEGLTNPAVPGLQSLAPVAADSGTRGASILGFYIALMIQTALALGALAVLLYMFLGAIGWITAGGDSGKIEKARDRIIQSVIGLAVLFSIVAIAAFVGPIFGLDLLNPVFVNQLEGAPTPPSAGRFGQFSPSEF